MGLVSTAIIYEEDTGWVCRALNMGEPPYPPFIFAGETEEAQAASVQLFGALMSENNVTNILAAMPQIFPGEVPNIPAQEAFNVLLEWADGMFLPGQVLEIPAEQFGVEVVADALPEYADMLLAFFAALAVKARKVDANVKFARQVNKTNPSAARRIMAATDAAPYSMTWTNYTQSSTFNYMDCNWQMEEGFSTIVTQPNDQPIPPFQSQSFSWSEIMSNLANGDTWAYMEYQCPNGFFLGVKLTVPFQFLDMGPAPYYQIWENGAWGDEYTSTQYTFDSSCGFSITVNPVAGHTSLSLNINIDDTSDAIKAKRNLEIRDTLKRQDLSPAQLIEIRKKESRTKLDDRQQRRDSRPIKKNTAL